jgi:hypothetical protein
MSEGALSEIAGTRAAMPTNAISRQSSDGRFYLAMAIASACLVFLGFGRSYYLKAYFGAPRLSPLLHVHALVFTSWMIFFIAQTALIASNRPGLHRWLGYAGGFLASAMVVLGVMVAFNADRLGHRNPFQDADTVFLVSLGDIFTFAVFVAAGFWWRRNREIHQRVMLLAVVAGLLSAAIPRLPVIGVIGGVSPGMVIVGLGFLLAGPAYDLISRRRIHPAYIVGCLFSLATLPPIRLIFARTPAWHHIAKWLIGL